MGHPANAVTTPLVTKSPHRTQLFHHRWHPDVAPITHRVCPAAVRYGYTDTRQSHPCHRNFSRSAIRRTPPTSFWPCWRSTASNCWPTSGGFRVSKQKTPQFNQDQLASTLSQAGIEYRWFEILGGRRGKSASGSSQNLGLRNESFRNYADYMLTNTFRQAIEHLLAVAGDKPTALMCSESVFWRCHRRLVGDFLLVKGIAVRHIMPSGELRSHKLTTGAQVEAGVLTYPAPGADQARLLFD